jgi:hypothetical protein
MAHVPHTAGIPSSRARHPFVFTPVEHNQGFT